jgi:hypothetical protein
MTKSSKIKIVKKIVRIVKNRQKQKIKIIEKLKIVEIKNRQK